LDPRFDLDKHPSLEAMVVDHADEIAYTSHDIDDGIKYGLISFEDLLKDELCLRVDDMVQKEGVQRDEKLYRHRFVAGLIKLLVEDFIENSKQGAKQYRQDIPICVTLDAKEKLPVGFSKETATQLKKLKKLLLDKLYKHQKIARKMHAGKQCIKGLYKAFSEDKNLLPPHQKELFEVRKKERVIADYIAAMTDRYAMKTYHEIYGLTL
jgi:dGTPase